MDYTDLRKALRVKHAQSEEGRERRRRRLRMWLHAILVVLAMAVFLLFVHRVAQ
jgi:type VI protein secretion system component VasF